MVCGGGGRGVEWQGWDKVSWTGLRCANLLQHMRGEEAIIAWVGALHGIDWRLVAQNALYEPQGFACPCWVSSLTNL